jgi:NADH-ubiquinone oxidoreductase chain 2
MFTNSINHLQKNIHSTYINRITIITLLVSILYTFNTLYFQSIGKGISLYNGLYQATVQSHLVEILLLIVGISILLSWPFISCDQSGVASASRQGEKIEGNVASISKSDQYSLIAIFSILGGSLLMSSLDLLSMYLSIELQSFALYILATLNKDKLSATSAGLKYFLLGSLSSCFILLGSAIIYSYTGLTQFEAINTLLSVPYFNNMDTVTSLAAATSSSATEGLTLAVQNSSTRLLDMLDINKAFTIGIIIILIGFLFKISAAPFYQWAPDVYDGTPTIVTVWLTIVVKLTIFIFLQGLIEFTLPDSISLINNYVTSLITPVEQGDGYSITDFTARHSLPNAGSSLFIAEPQTGIENFINRGSVQIKNLLLISSLLSLLVGTIAGLSQNKVKRLLAFSSISHVGFLLLALGIYTQKSIDSFIFYLVQYTITSLNIFLILLAFGYLLYYRPEYFYPASRKASEALLSYPKAPQGGEKKQLVKSNHISPLSPAFAGGAEQEATAAPAFAGDAGAEGHSIDAGDKDLNYLIELKGQLYKNPVLSISLAICLFSMAGIPPLIGFFSKQFVLFSSIENGNKFLSIIAILVSVISASYYLKLIKITFFSLPLEEKARAVEAGLGTPAFAAASRPFGKGGKEENLTTPFALSIYDNISEKNSKGIIENPSHRTEQEGSHALSNIHSYIIAILTFLILFFFLDPSILLNGTQLISLTIFNL